MKANKPIARLFGRTLQSLAGVALAVGVSAAQAGPVSGQGTWETTLQGRDINGNPVPLLVSGAPNPAMVFVYDTVLNLTWLANWNYGAGSSFDDGFSTTDGRMTWSSAMAWAAALDINGFGGWSLPSVLDIYPPGCSFSFASGTECGYNVYSGEAQRRGSPLAHMFYDTLGNLAYCPPGNSSHASCYGPGVPQPGWGLTNTGPFSNMQVFAYWSGTVYDTERSGDSWYFETFEGSQFHWSQLWEFNAVAVRPGDVFAGSVPEPGSLAMLVAALGALAVARRRRTH